jgi:uncharacterized zinc-type alcohol dehydrogenase-like protein
MSDTRAYAMHSAEDRLAPHAIERRAPGPRDVVVEIDYCGICHSDIHFARNDWGNAMYPAIPGHEIIGRVSAVGDQVKDHAVGDLVGVGCLVESCKTCEACEDDEEQYCEKGWTGTYGSKDPHLGGPTFGGYSERIVVREDFVLTVPDNLDPAGVAPLLCAGITTYSPLKHWNVGPGQKIGVIGLGGLGHMGVKLARAMGAHVVMLTTSPEKAKDAERLGAHEVLVTKDKDQMKAHAGSFDFLLNTVPVAHELNGYVGLLHRNGTMVIVGAIDSFDGVHTGGLIMGRKRIAGSLIGGIAETQEMLDFCGEHGITADIELTAIEDVNEAWEKVVSGDVRYRYVIDMASLKKSG